MSASIIIDYDLRSSLELTHLGNVRFMGSVFKEKEKAGLLQITTCSNKVI